MTGLRIEAVMQQVIKKRKQAEKEIRKLFKKVFKRTSDGLKFRDKFGKHLGIVRCTMEAADYLIELANEVEDFYFVDMKEDWETGDIFIKFEHPALSPIIEGAHIYEYDVMELEGKLILLSCGKEIRL